VTSSHAQWFAGPLPIHILKLSQLVYVCVNFPPNCIDEETRTNGIFLYSIKSIGLTESIVFLHYIVV